MMNTVENLNIQNNLLEKRSLEISLKTTKAKIMQVLKYGKLVGSYYTTDNRSDTLVIVGIGAPNLMDVDNLRNAHILINAGYDLITPEYYGFCRSEGRFTPKNSIKTLIDTKDFFKKGEALSIYDGVKVLVSYNRFIFLGLSYGGGVVPLLPKYDSEIQNIAMFYPVIDYSSFGQRGVKEETVDDFLRALKTGFSKFYRGINLPIWERHFQDKTDFIPNNNLEYLKDTNLFLAHGTGDQNIYYKKTSEYYQRLKSFYPNGNFIYKEYEGLRHGEETMLKASYDMIDFFQ